MSGNKNFVDINNLSQFWTNAKDYIDNNISNENIIIPEYNSTGTYNIKSNTHYDFGIKNILDIQFNDYTQTSKYSFHFISGAIPTNISINYVIEELWSDPMNEPYTEYYVNIINDVVYVKKSYYKHYLMFGVLEDGTFSFSQNDIDYSLNGGSIWTTLTAGSSTPTIPAGSKVMWRINNPTISSSTGIGKFSSTGKFVASGNVMSLLYGDDFEGKIDLTGKNYAFSILFDSCINLVDISNLELPATTLANGCYLGMFGGCTLITSSPILPATTLANTCYMNMFGNCSSLQNVTALHANASLTNVLNWLVGTNSTGTYIKNSYYTKTIGIPTGWTVKDYEDNEDYSSQYLTMEIVTAGVVGFARALTENVEYSLDNGATWIPMDVIITADMIDEKLTKDLIYTPILSPGQKVLWRGIYNYNENYSIPGIGMFYSTCDYNISGNIMSMVAGKNFKDANVDDINLNMILYGTFGYINMVMLYEIYSENSNYHMIPGPIDASNLILFEKLNGDNNYYMAFGGCGKLKYPPKLSATTLTGGCYSWMFSGCTSLTTAPILPATTLTDYCYAGMFRACSNLKEIIMLATDVSTANYCLDSWVDGVASTGTFTKASSMTSLPTGTSGIPSGWTVINK